MKKVLFFLFISFNLGFSQDTDTHLGRVNEALTQSLVGGKKIRFNDLGVGLTNNNYLSTSILFKGKNNLDLGIGYEFSQRKGLSALRENTMEFVLRYRFSQNDKTSNLTNQNNDE